jgi:uncharacterized lipoprotein YddW (UPF0748 family)
VRPFRRALLALSLLACGTTATEAGAPSPSTSSGPPALDGTTTALHDRELRGAWIATVGNTTWPSKTGLLPDAAKAELTGIFDALAQARMNAVFFQVRPESDALYASTLEPWSRFLTGTQGQDPGWDPLAFAVTEGHRRGLEVHAWLNPYRGLVDATAQVAPNHPTKTLASATRKYGTQLWMDPGAPEVREHIVAVVRDIVGRYDVDGVHFDDYFYPYPVDGQTFDDAATYGAYTSGGGTLGRDDWRRSNVDALVRETGAAVLAVRDDARFGVSPFGIYRPGMPPGITGLDAYATLYADPVGWIGQGWVDYVAPQLYWPTTQQAQAFGALCAWWAAVPRPRGYVFVGHDATKAGSGAFSVDEYAAELDLVRGQRKNGVLGSIFFEAGALAEDRAGLRSRLASAYYTSPAATPPLASVTGGGTGVGTAPVVDLQGRTASVPTPGRARAVVLYRRNGSEADPEVSGGTPTAPAVGPTPGTGVEVEIERVIPATPDAGMTSVDLDGGSWALTVLDRRGVETPATVLDVR